MKLSNKPKVVAIQPKGALEGYRKLFEALLIVYRKDRTVTNAQYLKVFDYFIKYEKTNGTQQLIELVKFCRLSYLRHLSGEAQVPQTTRTWVAINRRTGLPKILKHLVERETMMSRRLTLTLLFVTRWIPSSGTYDLSTVNGGNRRANPTGFYTFLKSKDNPFRYWQSLIRQGFQHKYHITNKAGPNGHALLTCHWDVSALEDKYFRSLEVLAGHLFVSEGIHVLKDVRRIRNYSAPPETKGMKLLPRRITAIQDKECKMRIVAIPDYFTQFILRGLHENLNEILEKIPEDCTFNQSNFISLKDNDANNTFYSIDLKAATDLMPSHWQARMLAWLFGDEEVGSAWHNMVAEHPWYLDGKPVFYQTGQPMGMYGSWPVMALTHHALVRYAWHKAGLPYEKGRYALLGDDLLIKGDEYYHAYREVIDEAKMQLSESKTFKSKRFFEFAKRFFYEGQEISPFPLGAVGSSKGDIPMLSAALDNALAKSWPIRMQEGPPDLLCQLLLEKLGSPSFKRLGSVLMEQLGALQTYHWCMGKELSEQQHAIRKMFWAPPCNRSEQSSKDAYLYYLATSLEEDCTRKATEVLKAAKDLMEPHLPLSGKRKMKMPVIGRDHVIHAIANETMMLNNVFVDDARIRVDEGPKMSPKRVRALLKSAIIEIPTPRTTYNPHLNRPSYRRQQSLARAFKYVKTILNTVMSR